MKNTITRQLKTYYTRKQKAQLKKNENDNLRDETEEKTHQQDNINVDIQTAARDGQQPT